MEEILSVKNLSAYYNKKLIINNISFNSENGKLLCLVGPNGSGKSTLLSVLAKIEIPDLTYTKNSVFIKNLSIDKMQRTEISKNISLMIQNETPAWNFSVFDFVMLGRFAYGDEDSSQVNNILKLLNISELKNRNINTLSGGEFQKVRIARSLVQESSIILLDEPLSSLDINQQFVLLNQLKKICKEKNICIIISIHDINLASIFADKIFLIGKVTEPHQSEEQNQKQLLMGTAEEIITKENLSKVYNSQFEIFSHPEYNKPQIYIKGF